MKDFQQEIRDISGWLSKIGADPSGGMTRLLYTPEWIEAQHALKNAFEAAGLNTHFDAVGNLFGRLEGSKYPDQVILSGSHIDTVVNGGNLDGQFGIEAAFMAIKHLKDTYGPPLRSLEVIALAEEEGSRFLMCSGAARTSSAWPGGKTCSTLRTPRASASSTPCATPVSISPPHQPLRSDIAAFVEIHIEQGKVLETEGKTIGVVTSIVGQRRYDVRLQGKPTTPAPPR